MSSRAKDATLSSCSRACGLARCSARFRLVTKTKMTSVAAMTAVMTAVMMAVTTAVNTMMTMKAGDNMETNRATS